MSGGIMYGMAKRFPPQSPLWVSAAAPMKWMPAAKRSAARAAMARAAARADDGGLAARAAAGEPAQVHAAQDAHGPCRLPAASPARAKRAASRAGLPGR